LRLLPSSDALLTALERHLWTTANQPAAPPLSLLPTGPRPWHNSPPRGAG
jgi:hypothetical protein